MISEVIIHDVKSETNLVNLFSEIDDDYRRFDFRITEEGDLREAEQENLRIIE
jgi:hypothetical protein